MRPVLAIVALATSVAAQAVTDLITPAEKPPAGCGVTRQGAFQITIVNITDSAAPAPAGGAAGASTAASSAAAATSAAASQAPAAKRSLHARQQNTPFKPLEMTLTNGVLTDDQNRTGYIAENFQFQFDGPPQAGAIYTGGFSLCTNGSIALGGSAVWWQCLSGDFFNLYDRKWADHCVPCYFEAIGGAGGSVDLSATPTIATATAKPSTSGSANGTSTDSGDSAESTGDSESGSGSGSRTGSGSSSSASASASGTASGSDATQLVPSVLSVLSLAVVLALQL